MDSFGDKHYEDKALGALQTSLIDITDMACQVLKINQCRIELIEPKLDYVTPSSYKYEAEQGVQNTKNDITVPITFKDALIGHITFIHLKDDSKPQTDNTVISMFVAQVLAVYEVYITKCELHDRTELHDLIMQNNTDYIFVKDDEFRIVAANRKFLTIYPETLRDSVIGYTTVENYDEEDAKEFLSYDRQALAHGYAENVETIVFPDGIERTLHTKKIRFTNKKNQFFVLGVARDISELQEQQRVIARIQRLDAIGLLAAGISHDFNNILSIIQGNVELLKTKNHQDTLRVHIEKIASATQRAKNLTGRLLRATSKDKAINEPDISIVEAINQSIALLEEVTPANVKVNWDVDPHAVALVSSQEFEDALTNLYVNSLNAIKEHGEINITTEQKAEFIVAPNSYTRSSPDCAGPFVVISISDSGEGIKPQELDNIFLPFVSLTENQQGSGLGLSMVSGFVSRYGYGLTIESSPGRGTKMSIWIPKTEFKHENSDSDKSETSSKLRKLRIAVIDDEDDVLDATSDMLIAGGHTITKFNCAKQATAWLKNNSHELDLIVTDMAMPGEIQGIDIFNLFQSRTPVLILSGDATSLGALDPKLILEKPVTLNQLLDRVMLVAG